jgi:hypothetical protein
MEAWVQYSPTSERVPRSYSLRSFAPGLRTPWLDLIEARSDEEAIAVAKKTNTGLPRELWDRHRLVAAIPREG